MANEIDLYSGGDLQPYSPSQPLAPTADTWGNTDVDLLSDHSGGQVQQLFGTPMPAGTSPQQVQATLSQISGIFLSDMGSLNYPNQLIQFAIQFFMDNAAHAPAPTRRVHSFSIPKDLAGDQLAEAFANHLSSQSGTQAQKQQFLTATLQWIQKLNQHLSSYAPAQGSAPITAAATSDPMAGLNDAQYKQVVAANNAAALATEETLRQRWGSSYTLNLQVAQQYLNNLPAQERAHFDQYTTGFIHSLNTVPVLEFLFNNAIGKASIPTSGGAVQQEIDQIHNLMKVNRKAYNSDNQIQARLRTLYDIQSKQ